MMAWFTPVETVKVAPVAARVVASAKPTKTTR